MSGHDVLIGYPSGQDRPILAARIFSSKVKFFGYTISPLLTELFSVNMAQKMTWPISSHLIIIIIILTSRLFNNVYLQLTERNLRAVIKYSHCHKKSVLIF